jgi:eukaryotic-like serine/threonine-protein kinase
LTQKYTSLFFLSRFHVQSIRTTLPINSIVGDRYQIEGLLGKGGFGSVYLVRDLRVRQNVFALKEIVDPAQNERRHFTFEAELLKRTDHPSLPRVYRVFDDPTHGRAYMLMDYIEGPNLEKLRSQQPKKRLPLTDVLTLLGPIVEALAYLHIQEPPIVHRDIKPSNIIAPDSGERTMLVDFGIAKEFDQEATTTAIRQATPGYGAPEQYGTGTDTRTDIYGLGATLYTLLTGTPPVDAFFRMTRLLSQQSDPLPTVKECLPNIPEQISAAIVRAMDLEKNERFPTVEDFWQALQPETYRAPVVAVAAIGAATPTVNFNAASPLAPERAARPARPYRKGMVIVLLLLLALVIGFVSALFLLPKPHNQQANVPTATVASRASATVRAVTATAKPTPPPQPTSTPKTQPTAPSQASFPALTSSYVGSLYDDNGGVRAAMSLQGIAQNGQNIQGTFHVSSPLSGNGPFTGTVKTSSAIQFIVHSSDASAASPLLFTGQIQQNGNMSGQYCSLDASGQCSPASGGYGSWSVQPGNSGS